LQDAAAVGRDQHVSVGEGKDYSWEEARRFGARAVRHEAIRIVLIRPEIDHSTIDKQAILGGKEVEDSMEAITSYENDPGNLSKNQ
jgi:hypothetical protein